MIPGIARWLIGWMVDPRDRDVILGDLEEEMHCHIVPRFGRVSGQLWMWRQIIGTARQYFFPPGLFPQEDKENSMASSLLQEIRYAGRRLSRNVGFTVMVAAVLALGIGANTTVFTLVDALLSPFDYPQSETLVGVGPEFPRQGQQLAFWETLSPPEIFDIAEQSRTLENVVGWDMGWRQIAGSELPESTMSAFWWGNVFETLRVQPAVGRGFLPEETSGAGARVAVVSYRFFQRRFAGDPDVVGSSILINGQPYTLIGVMPPGTLIYGTDLWIPMGIDPGRFPRNRRQMQLLARIVDGLTIEQVNAELAALAGGIEQEFAAEFEEYQGWRLTAVPWAEINTEMLRPAGLTLMGAVGFVLLLVCTTMASLFLARSLGRRKEIAVRAALGASRRRLIALLLTESVMVAIVGGGLGVILAYLAIGYLNGLLASIPFVSFGLELNERVLIFCGAISVASGILLGLLPAIRVSRADLQQILTSEGAGMTLGIGRQRLQSCLVGIEVALAVILMISGGAFTNSLIRLQSVDPGFDTENILTMRLTLPPQRPPAEREVFLNNLIERVESLPGVLEASATSQLPTMVIGRRPFWVEGRPQETDGQLPSAYTTLVKPGFFEALGVPLRQGRLFEDSDRPGGQIVAVINDQAARLYFEGEDPIGQRFRLGGASAEGPLIEIVGIVGSVRNSGPDVPPQPELFASFDQIPGLNQFHLVVKTATPPRSLVDPVRQVVQALDAEQPVYMIGTMEELFAASIADRRVATAALSGFALFALLLAAGGIAAVVSFKVAASRHEIGVRMALGAAADRVRRQIVRQAMLPVATGATVGVALSLAMVRLLGQQVDGLEGFSLLTLVIALFILAAAAGAASFIPAWRAVRADPLSSLRTQ